MRIANTSWHRRWGRLCSETTRVSNSQHRADAGGAFPARGNLLPHLQLSSRWVFGRRAPGVSVHRVQEVAPRRFCARKQVHRPECATMIRFKKSKRRGVLTLEWVLLITVVVIGVIGGLGAVRNAMIGELQDLAEAIEALNFI